MADESLPNQCQNLIADIEERNSKKQSDADAVSIVNIHDDCTLMDKDCMLHHFVNEEFWPAGDNKPDARLFNYWGQKWYYPFAWRSLFQQVR